MLLYAGKLNFIIHSTFAMSNETPPAKQADPCHPKGELMRKRRTQGQQAAASGVSLWVSSTHLEACSGGNWIICHACPPTMQEKP